MNSKISVIAILLLSGCFGDKSENKASEKNEHNKKIQVSYQHNGLYTYLQSYATNIPDSYLYGTSHYSPVWSLIEKPIDNFQIGLPGTWLIPDNTDNDDTPLCPEDSLIRRAYPNWGPTWDNQFQTIEGSSGYWALSRFKTTSPKYSLNSTADCYDTEVATPGWSFFKSSSPLADNKLGIAQLSNRMLMPPDGLTFKGTPKGELIGYGYFALPLTARLNDETQTGNQHWTLFLNSSNFKGPLAFFVPQMWSKISENYVFNIGRGLDNRALKNEIAMAIEVNSVPQYKSTDHAGVEYSKIPKIKFPIDDEGRISLIKDLHFYSKQALYYSVKAWREENIAPTTKINLAYAYKPQLNVNSGSFEQDDKSIINFDNDFELSVFNDGSFGIQFSQYTENMGIMPRYFKNENNIITAISENDVPIETKLIEQEFPIASSDVQAYSALPLSGSWKTPGPVSEQYTVNLVDCTEVTYVWYRFIEQPVFQQYSWSNDQKNILQNLIEKMHQHWTIDKEYLPPVDGKLAGFDEALIVTPPQGLEIGYVPIVTSQKKLLDNTCK
jgi:hypothetical protein